VGATGAAGATGPAGATGATGPQGPAGPVNLRAGAVTLRSSGTPAGITAVTFTSGMTCGASYTVSLTLTSSTSFSNNTWGYGAATSKTATGFSILLNTSGGSAFNAPAGTTMDWIATCSQ
jgi:hypothetical protein